jgi:hypothetical protein
MVGMLGFFISFLFSLSTNGFITSMYRGIFTFLVFFVLTFILKTLMRYATTDSQLPASQDNLPSNEQTQIVKKEEESFSDEEFKHLASIIKEQLSEK